MNLKFNTWKKRKKYSTWNRVGCPEKNLLVNIRQRCCHKSTKEKHLFSKE